MENKVIMAPDNYQQTENTTLNDTEREDKQQFSIIFSQPAPSGVIDRSVRMVALTGTGLRG